MTWKIKPLKTFKVTHLKVKTILMLDLHCKAYNFSLCTTFLQHRKVEISKSIFCTYKKPVVGFQAD